MASSDNFNDIPGVRFYDGGARAGQDAVDSGKFTHAVVDGVTMEFHHPGFGNLREEWQRLKGHLPRDDDFQYDIVQSIEDLCRTKDGLFEPTLIAEMIKEICDEWCVKQDKAKLLRGLEFLKEVLELKIRETDLVVAPNYPRTP